MLIDKLIETKIPAKIHLLFLMLGVVGATTILIATANFGAGLSVDSIGYLAATRNLADGRGFLWYNGEPIDFWPPLYPAILAIADKFLGVDFLVSAPILNALLFGIIVYLSGLLFFSFLKDSPNLAILATIYVLLAGSLFSVSVMAWSEPLFILLVLTFLLGIYTYLARQDRFSFLIFTLSAMLACLTRYIGVTLIFAGIVIILTLGKGRFKGRLISAFIFAIASALPLGIWLIINYIVGGTIAGYREASTYTIFNNISFTLYAIIKWVFPTKIISFLPHPVVLLLSALVCGFLVVIFYIFSRKYKSVFVNRILPLVFLTSIYLAFLIQTATKISFEKIENRYVSPVFIPIVLIILILIQTLMFYLEMDFGLSSRKTTRFLTILFAILLLFPLGNMVISIKFALDQGVEGYNSKQWLESQTIAYLKQHTLPKGVSTYSNDPYVLYLYTDIIAKSFRNIKSDFLNPKEAPSDLKKAHLIWFDDAHRGYYQLEEVTTIASSSPIAQFSDGIIYDLQPKK